VERAALFKLTVNKSFTYRGAREEYSNSYVFSGPTPADLAAWTAWAVKVKDLEKTMLLADTQFVDWYGYAPGSWETKPTHVDAQGLYGGGVVGTLANASGQPVAPGDVAFWVRWDTGQFTNPGGKRIYLRKYFHGVMLLNPTQPDVIYPTQVSAAQAYGAAMYSGSGLIGTARLARETGTLPVAHGVSPFATTRTLKRRGKRRPT
jgi:hypothetical protein